MPDTSLVLCVGNLARQGRDRHGVPPAGACTVALFFVGTHMVCVAAVAACALAYQRLAQPRLR